MPSIDVQDTLSPSDGPLIAGIQREITSTDLSYKVFNLVDTSVLNLTPRMLFLGSNEALALSAQQDTVVGNPLPPSLKVRQNIYVGPIRWPIKVGQNTLTIDCLYTPDDGVSTRPQAVAKANAAVGLVADLTVTIAAGADIWHTSPSLSFIATAIGSVDVYLLTRNPRIDGDGSLMHPYVTANWDNIVRS